MARAASRPDRRPVARFVAEQAAGPGLGRRPVHERRRDSIRRARSHRKARQSRVALIPPLWKILPPSVLRLVAETSTLEDVVGDSFDFCIVIVWHAVRRPVSRHTWPIRSRRILSFLSRKPGRVRSSSIGCGTPSGRGITAGGPSKLTSIGFGGTSSSTTRSTRRRWAPRTSQGSYRGWRRRDASARRHRNTHVLNRGWLGVRSPFDKL